MRASKTFLVLAAILLLMGVSLGLLQLPSVQTKLFAAPTIGVGEDPAKGNKGGSGDTVTIEVTDYSAPPQDNKDGLTDDTLDQKHTTFDPALVDSRPLKGWLINSSDAVLRLDVPMVLPDSEGKLLDLHPSYVAAIKAARLTTNRVVLPSVNLIDGKAKQFDDGLYAALDRAYYKGLEAALRSHVDLVRAIALKAGPDSPAAPYLAAGLEVAGVHLDVKSAGEKARLLQEFQSNEVRSKPIGFYTWNKDLGDTFRFLRFFQAPFFGEMAVPEAIGKVLAEDKPLMADYRKAIGFFARLTNPIRGRSIADYVDDPKPSTDDSPVAFFPASTSREGELFRALFPLGLPENVDLMRELVTRIRSGKVNLKPKPNSGWYDYQVYALETLLLPEKGVEKDKLLLTRAYKKRMLEAFKALITKRRETHARALENPAPRSMARPPEPLQNVEPQLRVEPNPTYFLRTARAYAFLASFLDSAIGEPALKSLHGLRKEGDREPDLASELAMMRELFYGLYLVSCEDIGLKPGLLDGESIDRERCEKTATEWLAKAFQDRDLAVDTRVSVPIYVDTIHRKTKLWTTLGVRLAKLDVGYARGPSIKPKETPGDWTQVKGEQLRGVSYVIPVDEFAEVELTGLRVLDREELRALCDKYKTKAAILKALND